MKLEAMLSRLTLNLIYPVSSQLDTTFDLGLEDGLPQWGFLLLHVVVDYQSALAQGQRWEVERGEVGRG